MLPLLDEKQRRLFLASEALAYGRGGIAIVHRISGTSKNTIKRGIKEHNAGATTGNRVRAPGGGRHLMEENRPEVVEKILEIVNRATYGNPQKVLSYTTESLRKIAGTLNENGIKASYVTVGKILEDNGYSKQANQKMLQVGEPSPDRNEQFQYINWTAQEYIDRGEPVISVDTKKKENIGNFKNSGTEYRRGKDPRKVLDHDFPIKDLGKIAPYGVFCQNNNTGFVNVGTSHDTADFAVESITRWWRCVGKHTFPRATKLLITCDCGGSNGYTNRLWKFRLAHLAVQTGLDIHVCHFPPGTSKWNKVEHRLFCYISRNWQGKPLIDVETAISLIGSTTTSTGLNVICQRDDTVYETAQSVSDEEYESIPLTHLAPFGSWNYVLHHL